jgi:hypothetical protein
VDVDQLHDPVGVALGDRAPELGLERACDDEVLLEHGQLVDEDIRAARGEALVVAGGSGIGGPSRRSAWFATPVGRLSCFLAPRPTRAYHVDGV